MYQGYETLEVTRADGIVTVAFNRPEVKNATNMQMHEELVRIFPEIGRDPEAQVVVLTGNGSAFSAGGNIESMRDNLADSARWTQSILDARDILMGVIDLDRPVIAKVNGHAIGLGATLALLCDIIVANEKALIADPHVKVGLVAGDGGSVIWPALVGYAKAKKYLLTGGAIDGAEAERIGLVSEAVPAEELDARVHTIAQELAAGAAMAIRLTKKAINMDLRQRMDRLVEAHLGYETTSYLSDDHREAVSAFIDKRSPKFTGK